MRLQRYIKYPIPTKSFQEKLLKTYSRVAFIHPIANDLHGWKKFSPDCVIDALGHPGSPSSLPQNHPCRSVSVPAPVQRPPKTQPQRSPKSEAKGRNHPTPPLLFPKPTPSLARALPSFFSQTFSSPPPRRAPKASQGALPEAERALLPRASKHPY